jgi:hypothetical protein
MIRSKLGQRVVGAIDLVGSAALIAWVWQGGPTGRAAEFAAAVMPFLAVVGLGLLVVPIDVDRHRAKHGTDRPATFAELPAAWKVLMVVGFVAGLAHWLAWTAAIG